ncbi:acpt protein [Stylonychia lemnae]|uniref:Acpt protein n=1 Tax=Stylonychia lemnae TaxID=5949 RepID=A0A078B8U6_STYLE|nr:acpt protein [Stylonychia lemnae]|eukprot:CDW89717.1 acpt protein [Stylonychia lemnae]
MYKRKTVLLSVLMSLLGLTTQQSSTETLLLVIEVARHGARSPEQFSQYNKTSVNFNDTSQLLEGGWDQHYEIGKSLRQRLVTEQKLLSADYSTNEVYAQATSATRTLNSTQAQLSGLFPDQAPAHKWLKASPGTKTQGYTINQIAQADNLITRLNEANCAKYKSAFDDVTASAAYKRGRGYWYQTYNQTLSNLVGRPNLSETQFDATCEYLFFSQYTNIVLNFTPTAFDRAYCSAYEDGWIYKTSFGTDQEWKLVSYEFLNQLNEFALFLNGTRTIAQLTTFQKYFKKTAGPMPKFLLYLSHDEIMSAYLEGLGFHQPYGSFPAAGIFFEFFRDSAQNNQIFVRTYFKQTLGETKSITLADQTSNVISLAAFQSTIAKRIQLSGITDIAKSCAEAYVSSNTYYDPELYITELKQKYAADLSGISLLQSMTLKGLIMIGTMMSFSYY